MAVRLACYGLMLLIVFGVATEMVYRLIVGQTVTGFGISGIIGGIALAHLICRAFPSEPRRIALALVSGIAVAALAQFV